MDKLSTRRGFSLIEILIAMAIALIVISGVVASSGGFGATLRGYQSTIMNSQTNAEAITKGQRVLEEQQALARQDFALVTNTATTSIDGFYYKAVDVSYPDAQTALVTATISWWNDHNATSTVRVSTLVTNLENVNSPNTCNSVLTGNWTNPQISAPINVEDPASSASGNPVTDIDVIGKKLYITTDNSHGHNADFYIFDASVNPQSPTYLNSTTTLTVHAGLNSVTVASTTSTRYAFVASAYDPNFKTCKPGPSCSQLQIINVTNPMATVLTGAYYLLPTSTPPYVWGNVGSGSDQAVGKSVFYKDGFVYLGLTTTSNGPGFHIIDVGNGAFGGTPTSPKYVSSWPSAAPAFGSSGAPINGIYVKGSYAYLSHPTGLIGTSGALTEQITVLDVSDPLSPQRVGWFFNSGGIGGNGKMVYPVGSTLYVGRTQTSNAHPEFYILNNTDPSQLSTNNPSPPGRVFGETVNGIVVRSNLAFIISNNYARIFDISNPMLIGTETPVKSWKFTDIGLGPNSLGSASDCEGNNVYVGSYRSSNDKGVFLVIYPGP